MAEWVRIVGDRLSAAINPFGAELSSLCDAEGRELMTDADPAFWTGRAPILFPVVGAVADDMIRVDGRTYPMKKHGFARHRAFEPVEQAASRAVFALRDDAETRESYPFAFELTLAFEIAAATLSVTATVANPGDVPLPASFGFHPAFAWPLPYGAARAEHRIVFERDEPEALRLLDPAGLIATGERATFVEGRTLRLADPLFRDDALIWDAVRSQAVRYGAGSGPQLEIAFPDTPMLGIWTKPGAAYVCIEPWHGIADPSGYAGEFRDKPGVFDVAPGAAKRIGMSVTLA